MSASESTIAALATPPGVGGVAVVRISGAEAYEIAGRVFRPKDERKSLAAAKGYSALLGYFVEDGAVCDEVIALCFRAPHSYTGEDVVELSCHGGLAVSGRLLRALFAAGAVPAGRGEFTKRAFLSGRISLTQAEAVMEMVNASSRQGMQAAAAVMDGALYRKIESVRGSLVALAGHIAAAADFPEEDVPELSDAALCAALSGACGVLNVLLDGYDRGAVLRRGVETVIVGSPNVGKSTLLNLLAGFERAIVTPVAGTTRDIVEQEVQLAGVRLRLADTAGLHDTDDMVEAEGIRRARQRLDRAALILAVFDASRPLGEEDILLARQCEGRPAVALLNKSDLPQVTGEDALQPYFGAVAAISARDETFLPTVERAVAQVLRLHELDPDACLLANERQRAAAQRARDALREAMSAAQGGVTVDAVGVCVDDALGALYELTGENASDAVIDEVFSSFCVGK